MGKARMIIANPDKTISINLLKKFLYIIFPMHCGRGEPNLVFKFFHLSSPLPHQSLK
jgi:hypothetical protein